MAEDSADLLVKLADTYGTPVYVIHEERLRAAYQAFAGAFAKRWQNTTVAYSYKTNFLLAVCRVFHSLGAWAEVTSGVEVHAAERLGVQPAHVVFNGPYKTDEELVHAIRSGYCVNVDGWHELERLSSLCRKLGPCRVGLRINSGTRNAPHWDKFGFSTKTGDAANAALKIAQDENLQLIGLHSHIGTNVPDTEPFFSSAKEIGGLSVEIEKRFDIRLQFIDLGGGFATPQPTPYFEDAWETASVDEYAEAITHGLRAADVRPDVQLILEPGRILTANAAILLTRIVDVKVSPARGLIVIVDTGVNQVPSASFMKHNIRQIVANENDLVETDIFGNLCMQADLLGVGIPLYRPKPSDLLRIEDVGAYNLSMAYPFIRLRPAVAIVTSSGTVSIARRREQPDDFLGLDVL